MASWLVHLTLDRAVRVRALAGEIVMCFWVRYITLTVPLCAQVYSILCTGKLMLEGDQHPFGGGGGVQILLVRDWR